MTNGFARYYTPSCYLDVIIRSTVASHWPPRTPMDLSPSVRDPSVRHLYQHCWIFGTTMGRILFGGRLEEGGRKGLEQDRTILLGMSTHTKLIVYPARNASIEVARQVTSASIDR